VYVSFDDGGHWQPLQMNLPVTSVRDLDVNGTDLVAATHGRAFWVLDDVTPLRQLETSVLAAPVHLFAPATAVRVRPAGFTGTPMPKDEPMAPNPPAGAVIDYVAKSGPVAIRILDPRGELVREYRSDDRRPAADLSKIRVAPEWVSSLAAPAAGPGMHRFVWPLRYPAPALLSEGDPYADGVWAPPGRYTVVLTSGGERRTQPLTLAPDPRVALPEEAYARQFALARRIEAALSRVTQAVDAADAAHGRLAGAAAPLDAQVQALAGPDFGAAPSGPPPRGITPLRVLATRLRTFEAAVDGADAAPSPDAEAGFKTLEPEIEAALVAWRTLEAQLPPAAR
jgi:hypothetical protein